LFKTLCKVSAPFTPLANIWRNLILLKAISAVSDIEKKADIAISATNIPKITDMCKIEPGLLKIDLFLYIFIIRL
jgi:hypothetical protein